MPGLIYLIGNSGELVELREQAYDSEDLLQGLLAKYPSILAGEQINSSEPRRWLLIAREAGLPSNEEGGARWSVDHLFLDQDGIPTLVEVKRSSDTRVRREVVGQMLDYAANAVLYWPVESIQALFESRCEKTGENADNVLAEFLADEAAGESFWHQVRTNLQAGRIRLVFVADEIPSELRRIVEFLNQQMDPTEVIALEVKQYAGGDLKTLVPRAIGTAVDKREERGAKRKWDETSFFKDLETRRGQQEADAARDLLSWARQNSLRIWWGEGQQDGSFYPLIDERGQTHWTFAVWTYGRVGIQFGMMKNKAPFAGEEKREQLRLRFNSIRGVSLPAESVSRYPGVPLSVLTDQTTMKQFTDVFQSVIDEVRGYG